MPDSLARGLLEIKYTNPDRGHLNQDTQSEDVLEGVDAKGGTRVHPHQVRNKPETPLIIILDINIRH